MSKNRYVALMEGARNAYKILVQKSEEESPLGSAGSLIL
jgi:hypothetical protein